MVYQVTTKSFVRDIRALHRNKVRRSRQQFIIEGVRLLEEALNSDRGRDGSVLF